MQASHQSASQQRDRLVPRRQTGERDRRRRQADVYMGRKKCKETRKQQWKRLVQNIFSLFFQLWIGNKGLPITALKITSLYELQRGGRGDFKPENKIEIIKQRDCHSPDCLQTAYAQSRGSWGSAPWPWKGCWGRYRWWWPSPQRDPWQSGSQSPWF